MFVEQNKNHNENMPEKEETKREVNPEAVAKNWEQRLRTELEAPHKWSESWGELFDNGVPHEYSARVAYMEAKLKSMPNVQSIPKYGFGEPFREVGARDCRRKKMFGKDENYSEEELQATAATMRRSHR